MTDPADTPDDATLRKILRSMKTVAVVGVSANPVRPSYFVARYLGLRGMRVIPVNPGLAGQRLFGEEVRATVADCPPEVDTIDVFRRSDAVPAIVDEAIVHLPRLKTVWLQIGVESEAARAACAERGLNFVQNRCPKIENQRLFGELRMGGFNTGVISSKL
ncbi:MAG: CoA-binding protein [Rhodobacter sp.]|nr:CoA-binding protein [Rhodobacter sp.]